MRDKVSGNVARRTSPTANGPGAGVTNHHHRSTWRHSEFGDEDTFLALSPRRGATELAGGAPLRRKEPGAGSGAARVGARLFHSFFRVARLRLRGSHDRGMANGAGQGSGQPLLRVRRRLGPPELASGRPTTSLSNRPGISPGQQGWARFRATRWSHHAAMAEIRSKTFLPICERSSITDRNIGVGGFESHGGWS